MDARVHASGDESLDLQALAGQVVFIISVTVVKSDAANVPERWIGQKMYGVLGPREYVAPEELLLDKSVIKLTQQSCAAFVRKARQGARGLRRCVRQTRP